MRILFIIHSPAEGEGYIGEWALKRGHAISKALLFRDGELPEISSFDSLFIMGGPMGVFDEEENKFLRNEKRFVAEAVSAGKKTVGICLGAQLIAHILGAPVTPNRLKEIGWFEVKLDENAENLTFMNAFPISFTAFHWHGDTFGIPDGAVRLASSEACANQAFYYEGNVIGLQFHLEVTPGMIENWLKDPAGPGSGPFIQSPAYIMEYSAHCIESRRMLYSFLDLFFAEDRTDPALRHGVSS
jgi:GMP synthase-like glutamine amidotransferase